MDQVKIGKFITECRKNVNITQKDLANKLNITDRAVSKWETGKSMPDIATLIPLSEILNVSIIELLNGEKNSENDEINIEEKILKVLAQINIEKNKKIINIIIKTIITIFSILAILGTCIFSKIHFYTYNPVKAFIGFVAIEFFNQDCVIVGNLPHITFYTNSETFDFDTYMKNRGFAKIDQMGQLISYTNGATKESIRSVVSRHPFIIYEWISISSDYSGICVNSKGEIEPAVYNIPSINTTQSDIFNINNTNTTSK